MIFDFWLVWGNRLSSAVFTRNSTIIGFILIPWHFGEGFKKQETSHKLNEPITRKYHLVWYDGFIISTFFSCFLSNMQLLNRLTHYKQFFALLLINIVLVLVPFSLNILPYTLTRNLFFTIITVISLLLEAIVLTPSTYIDEFISYKINPGPWVSIPPRTPFFYLFIGIGLIINSFIFNFILSNLKNRSTRKYALVVIIVYIVLLYWAIIYTMHHQTI